MYHITRVTILYTFLLLGLSLAGCGSDSESENVKDTVVEDTTALSQDEQMYIQAADKMVGQFMRSLQSELLKAAEVGDFTNAVEVCYDKAPEITNLYSGGGWTLKRVSDKFRNQDNRPDTLELSYLATFADSGGAPEFLFDWYDTDSTKTFKYYEPIVTKQICLNCHGDLQTMSSDTYRRIKKLYPMDRATGYKVGDLRGMFVVEADWPDGNELAEQVLAGAFVEELNRPVDTLVDSAGIDTLVDSTAVSPDSL